MRCYQFFLYLIIFELCILFYHLLHKQMSSIFFLIVLVLSIAFYSTRLFINIESIDELVDFRKRLWLLYFGLSYLYFPKFLVIPNKSKSIYIITRKPFNPFVIHRLLEGGIYSSIIMS